MKQPLDPDYLNGMIEKVLLTLEKYELIIPGIPEMIQEIDENLPDDDDEDDDHPGAVVVILKVLGKYKSASPFMIEMTKGFLQDFYHAVNKDLPKHEGEFYVTSVAD